MPNYITKFRKLLFTFIVIVIFGVIQANAQNEYFITNKNDTVRCTFVSFIGLPSTLRYKLTEDGQVNKVSKDTVAEYRQKNTIYAKRQLSGVSKPLFVQWLIKGRLNIYAIVTSTGYGNIID